MADSDRHSPTLPPPTRLGSSHHQQNLLHKHLRTAERNLHTRLLSILHDAHQALHLYETLSPRAHLPLFGNARAGSWYVPPTVNDKPTHTCSFKSADGHYGKWSSSLRRPNIHVLQSAIEHGGVAVVDVTRRGKKWPDSFMKTIPIWCAVLNAVIGLSECHCSDQQDMCAECVELHVHPDVPDSERHQIRSRLSHWIDDWARSTNILTSLIPTFASARQKNVKPLRPLWIRPESKLWEDGIPVSSLDFTPIICLSASRVVPAGDRSYVEPMDGGVVCNVEFNAIETGFAYVQGAGDDEEAWCEGLTAEQFWNFRERLMPELCANGATEERVCVEVARIVKGDLDVREESETRASVVGTPVWKTGIAVAKVPPEQLVQFADRASTEYDMVLVLGAADPKDSTVNEDAKGRPVCEGGKKLWFPLTDRKHKLDLKYGLGRALGPALSALRKACAAQRERALICCTSQTGDWSCALAIAWVAWQCKLELCMDGEEPDEGDGAPGGYVIAETRTDAGGVTKEDVHGAMLHFMASFPDFQISRASLKQINRFFTSPVPSSTLVQQ